jgi:hypothetical protein
MQIVQTRLCPLHQQIEPGQLRSKRRSLLEMLTLRTDGFLIGECIGQTSLSSGMLLGSLLNVP